MGHQDATPDVNSVRPQISGNEVQSSVSGSLLRTIMTRLQRLPVVGNVLRATVDPVYRQLINSIMPTMAENSKICFELELKQQIETFFAVLVLIPYISL